MSMKYKLLICVLAVLTLSAAAFAADVTFYTENFDGTTTPAYALSGNWGIGAPAKGPDGPTVAFSPTKVLAYNLNGNYGPSLPATYATSVAIDCTGKTGVKLSFERWLGVEDNYFDKATVEVSKDKTNWTKVWSNPTNDKHTDNLQDLTWTEVVYDISAVADNQKTVYVRWGLSSNGTNQFSGWAIDDVALMADGGDAPFSVPGPAFPADMTTTNPAVWQIGPVAAGGGQSGIGADPATNAPGWTGNVVGTVIGGNYPAGLAEPVYLTWGPLDLTGFTGTKLSFQRWLQVEDARYDRARIEVANTLDPAEGYVEDTSATTLNKTSKTKVYPLNTTAHFSNVLTVKYNTNNLAAGESISIDYTLDNSVASPSWTNLTSDAANTDNTVNSGVKTFTSLVLPVGASDNAKFAVRVQITTVGDASTAEVIVSTVSLDGILWNKVYENPAGSATSTSNTFDEKWTAVDYDLSDLADNEGTVYVRWSIGPTDSFANSNYGGWSMEDIRLAAGSRSWAFVSESAPTALVWGQSGAVTVNVKNTGTATWDKSYELFSVEGKDATTPDLGNPGSDLDIVALDTTAGTGGVIDRWGIEDSNVAVSGTVAPDASYAFKPSVVAPPLTSVVYGTPVSPTAPADPGLSVLGADWDVANETSTAAVDFLPTFMDGSIANAGIVTSRFIDDGPGTAGEWARFWIEELAGRAPMVVQGYGASDYRPTNVITRDQIAVYMARAAQVPVGTPTGNVFHDIPATFWAAAEIEGCAAAGIVSGYPDQSYQPGGQITRDAMAKFIANGKHFVTPAFNPAPTLTANPFPDVPYKDDSTVTPPIVANVFAPYIKAIADVSIVTGYPDKDANGNDIFTYRPANLVTRDQLAVYVWRALMRDDASVVVLGGPAITPVNAVTATYYGYTDSPDLVQQGDQNYAYITLDAVRLNGADLAGLTGDGNLDVQFVLREAHGISTFNVTQTVTIPAATLTTWKSQALSSTTGEPYRNVAWAIPTGLMGDYELNVSVEGKPLARKTLYSVMGNMFTDLFEDSGDLTLWTQYGQPDTGAAIYPPSDLASPNEDLFDGTGSLELKQTQQMVRGFSTVGRHNIRLLISLAATGLGTADGVKVEWSKDYGTKGLSATWAAVYDKKGADVPSKLTDVSFDLPNGDPTATPDPIIGADDNPDFAVRLSVSTTSTSARAYFDNLEIRGS